MKPLPDKDGNTSGWWDKYDRWHMGIAATHTESRTTAGPNYCQECSDAAGNWVRWPCSASRHLAINEGKYLI